MRIKVYKPTERERKAELELLKVKADVKPVKEKGRNDRVNRKIRERYSLSEELSILRKAVLALTNGQNVPEQYSAYNAFVEQCKKGNEH